MSVNCGQCDMMQPALSGQLCPFKQLQCRPVVTVNCGREPGPFRPALAEGASKRADFACAEDHAILYPGANCESGLGLAHRAPYAPDDVV